MNLIKKQICDYIKYQRSMQGFNSQEAIATAAGIPLYAMRSIELDRTFTIDQLLSVCEVLNIEIILKQK